MPFVRVDVAVPGTEAVLHGGFTESGGDGGTHRVQLSPAYIFEPSEDTPRTFSSQIRAGEQVNPGSCGTGQTATLDSISIDVLSAT